jgi:hypothetical protein
MEMRNAYRILVSRPERKGSLGRCRHRWDGNIKMNLKEVCYGNVNWIHLAQYGSSGGTGSSASLKAVNFLTS